MVAPSNRHIETLLTLTATSGYDLRSSWFFGGPELSDFFSDLDIRQGQTVTIPATETGTGVDAGESITVEITDFDYNVAGGLLGTGSSADYAQAAHLAAFDLTGDMDLRAKVFMPIWYRATGAQFGGFLVGRNNADVYYLACTSFSRGFITVYASFGGEYFESDPIPVTENAILETWFRVTLDINDGAGHSVISFFSSTDGATWTPISTPFLTTGLLTIAVQSTPMSVASATDGNFLGFIKQAIVMNGIAGTPVIDIDFLRDPPDLFTSHFTDYLGVPWTLGQEVAPHLLMQRGRREGAGEPGALLLRTNFPSREVKEVVKGWRTPDSAALSITGDIDLRAKVQLSQWESAPGLSGNQGIISKSAGTGRFGESIDKCSYMLLNIGLRLYVAWSPTGNDWDIFAFATADVSAVNGDTLTVRAALDVNNGAGGWTVRFYTSTDYDPRTGSGSWSQLGADVTGVGVTSIADTAAGLVAGCDAFNGYGMEGVLHWVEVRDGINGTVVANPYFDLDPASAESTTFADRIGNTWTNFGTVLLPPGELIEAAVTDTETGTGTDAGELVSVPFSDTETGSGEDTGEDIAAAVSGSDTASGADAEALIDLSGEGDTGSGADTGSIAAAVSDIETGSGADAEALVDLSGDGETGNGDDNGAIAAALTDADAGSGLTADEAIDAALSDAETGTGLDAGEDLAAALSDTETGIGADAGEDIAAALSDADTGSGLDAGELIDNAVADADTGSGVDAEALIDLSGQGENGSGAEDQGSIGAELVDAEVTAGADAGENVDATGGGDVPKSSSDDGTGTDAGEALAAALDDPDTAIGADDGSLAAVITSPDTSAGADAGESLAVSLSTSDAGAGADTGTVAAELTGDESGAVADAGEALGLDGVEAGTGDEDGTVSALVAQQETGSGSDAGEALSAESTDSDAGTALDAGEALGLTDEEIALFLDMEESIGLTDFDTGVVVDAGEVILVIGIIAGCGELTLLACTAIGTFVIAASHMTLVANAALEALIPQAGVLDLLESSGVMTLERC